MAVSPPQDVWDDITDRVGDDLRTLTRYVDLEFECIMRDDVRAIYSTLEDRKIVDDWIVQQLTAEESATSHKIGDLDAFIHVFDEAWVLVWPDPLPGKSGYIVSIQRNTEETSIDDLEWCIEYLSTEAPYEGG